MKKLAITKDDLDRLVALKALRENIYLTQPGKYSMTDIAEDLPGRLRTIAPLFADVLPARAIIDSDPEKRKEQIRIAMERIKATRSSNTELGTQMLRNAAVTGAVGLPIGFMLAAGIKLLGFRKPWRSGQYNIKAPAPGAIHPPAPHLQSSYKGTSTWSPNGTTLQSPITPISQIKKLLSSPKYRNYLAKYSLREGTIGAGIGAATGAAYPLVSHQMNLSDKRLDEAGQILQEHPYMTSLPVEDMMASIDEQRGASQNPIVRRLKGAAIGGGLGAAAGAIGAYTPAVMGLLGQAALKPFTHKPLDFRGFHRVTHREVGPSTLMMGGFGAAAGAVSPSNPLG